MIDLTYLYAGRESGSTPHRYGRALAQPGVVPAAQRHAVAQRAAERRPVVVWNMTRTCNLRCEHCYTCSGPERFPDELTTEEGQRLLDDLAAFQIPALLLSGGEPTMRPDFFELARYAVARKLRLVLSTNGTLLSRELIQRLKDTGFTYVGISLDGLEQTHDQFRRQPGAFRRVVAAFRHCRELGQKAGLRLTLTPWTVRDLPGILDFIEHEGIPRVCFYHLVPAGRGQALALLPPEQSRQAIETILARVKQWSAQPRPIEVLTVDNHCDGPFIYLKLLAEGRADQARRTLELLRWNGGGLYSSGVGIADVDFVGNVHPDQFWMDYTLGNVRQRPFSQIWQDTSDLLLAGLKDRRGRVKGRCGTCAYFDCCGGGLRSRAAHVTGDPWAAEPSCYLTDAEIAEVAEAGQGLGLGRAASPVRA